MDGSLILDLCSNLLILAQTTAQDATATAQAADGGMLDNILSNPYAVGAAYVLGIFVLPFVVSHLVTSALRMPSHSFRVGVMLAAISGGFLFAALNKFQLSGGIDMKGGTNLVYDIMADELGQKPDPASLSSALADRINPSGTKDILIRPMGDSQIEIVVPNTDELEIRRIKDLLQNSGQLEFRIVANTRDHADVIAAAKLTSESPIVNVDVVNPDNKVIGRWYQVGRKDTRVDGVLPLQTQVNLSLDTIRNSYTGEILNVPALDYTVDYALEKWLDENGVPEIDLLMSFEYLGKPFTEVIGDDLASATAEYDKSGQPIVGFRLTAAGAGKMAELTGRNQPDGDWKRRMAIIMDKKVLSAPQLNSTISGQGQITGNFSREEVEFLVTILRSGRLPATLSPEPASENRVGAGLGATTIRKGTTASAWAVIATFCCILLYYRFAGVVASVALVINGLLIFGIMIFIGQPLTLPGLAGLVLTVGMSVDANVLIFERIREEQAKGAAPRMAIRNGFDRAFTTIIDSNLTTLIAAIVLYWIGTDQVRGFAVALIIGIATSLFTATFCSRVIFEVCEKLKLVSLSMSDGVGFLKKSMSISDINFMGWKKFSFVFSLGLIVLGIAAISVRRGELLNIDFTGGTGVTMQFREAVDTEKLRELTRNILDEDAEGKPIQSTLVQVEKEPQGTVYSLVASVDDPDYLTKQLVDGFAETNDVELVTYSVEYMPLSASSSWIPGTTNIQYVHFAPQESAAPPAGETATTSPSPGDSEPSSSEGSGAGEQVVEAAVAQQAPAVNTKFQLKFGSSNDDNPQIGEEDKGAKVVGKELREQLIEAAAAAGVDMSLPLITVYPEPLPTGWRDDDISGHDTWTVSLPVDEASAKAIVAQLQSSMQQQPKWLSLSKIGTRVAGEMKQRAIAAILLSLIFIVAYIWFRFQKVAYGLAAVVALVHDVLITVGVLALCHWLAGRPPFNFLLIEDFKIGLTEVAAFLTIIGYSLNDTIVVFDRIREVRGRSPSLTAEMINTSVNQTLSRTLLTSGTTLITVLLLYIFGGEGIHAFAFALLVGVVVGTYSSIFVAAPVLLWISNREKTAKQQQQARVASA